MNGNILQEYLLNLGFRLDQPELDKLHRTLTDVSRQLESRTSGIVKSIASVGGAIAGTYAGIIAATVGLADHFAEADLKQQLFAMRMFMSVDAAKRLQIAQEALGYSLEEIVWNPELHRRYDKLVADQMRMQKYLGPDYKQQMMRLRDIRFEITRMKVEAQYLGMEVIKNIGKSFGLDEEQLLGKLRKFNDWIIQNLPAIASKISETLVPILRDIAINAGTFAHMLGQATSAGLKLLGTVFGDPKLQSGAVTFDNIARAIQQIAFHTALWVERLFAAIRSLGYLSKMAGEIFSGNYAGAYLDMKDMSKDKGAFDKRMEQIYKNNANLGSNPYASASNSSGASTSSPASSGAASSVAEQARALAKQVAARTGVPAELIYAQWAHETNGFTSRLVGDSNNLGGIKNSGGFGYRSFSSLSDFGNFYSRLLTNKRYTAQGVLQAQTPEDFAGALKRGGYYEDSYSNYLGGMKRWEPSYFGNGGSGGVTVGSIDIHIMQPNASAKDIKQATLKALDEKFGKKVQRNITQLSGAF